MAYFIETNGRFVVIKWKNIRLSASHSSRKTPSVTATPCTRKAAIPFAKSGGTAFPTCWYCESFVPLNSKESGNLLAKGIAALLLEYLI